MDPALEAMKQEHQEAIATALKALLSSPRLAPQDVPALLSYSLTSLKVDYIGDVF